MGQRKSTLLQKRVAKTSSKSKFGLASREKEGTLLHDAMAQLFDHQHNLEQSEEKYQNDYMHRDVEVISAAMSESPSVLKSLWRGEISNEVEPITHGLLKHIWTAASRTEAKKANEGISMNNNDSDEEDEEDTYPKVLTMNIQHFEVVCRKFMLESQEQSNKNLHRDLKVAMCALRNILETSLAREERKDEFAKQSAEELRHRLKEAGVWLQWQEIEMKKYVNETFHIFNDRMDQLAIGILRYFDEQREIMLRSKKQVCICITQPGGSIGEVQKTYAVTSYDEAARRPVVMYADPERVPRVESLELLIAHVGISNITLSDQNEVKYYDSINKKHTNNFKKHHSGIRNITITKSMNKSNNQTKHNHNGTYDANHPGIRDSTGQRVVHVEEFCKWFLQAVQHVFTVQNLITESCSAHPDIYSLFPNEFTEVMPSFTDEPNPSWYVNFTKKNGTPLPLKVMCPVSEASTGLHRGTVKKLKADGSFTYTFDKMGNNIVHTGSQTRSLTKWQLVEYGVFDFRTKDTRNLTQTVVKASSAAGVLSVGNDGEHNRTKYYMDVEK